jgi:hypothetical protein
MPNMGAMRAWPSGGIEWTVCRKVVCAGSRLFEEVQQPATNPALALAVTGPSTSRKRAARPIVSDLCFFRPLPPKGEALWQTAAMIGRSRHVSSDQEIPEALSIPQTDAHMVGPAAMG